MSCFTIFRQRRLVPRSRTLHSFADRICPPALVDWEYNAWGGKYPPFDLDNQVPQKIAELQGRRRFVPGIVLKEVRSMATAAHDPHDRIVLAESDRNPACRANKSKRICETTSRQKKYFGYRRRDRRDDTDGHIDQMPGS